MSHCKSCRPDLTIYTNLLIKKGNRMRVNVSTFQYLVVLSFIHTTQKKESTICCLVPSNFDDFLISLTMRKHKNRLTTTVYVLSRQ